VRVVVDSNVAVAWLLPDEPLRAQSIAVRADMAAGDLDPIVAEHFRFEVGSALIQAARRGRISWERVVPLLAALDAFELRTARFSQDDAGIVDLCASHRLSWADAHQVMTAHERDLPFVTADRRLVDALAGSDIWVEFLGDRPLA